MPGDAQEKFSAKNPEPIILFNTSGLTQYFFTKKWKILLWNLKMNQQETIFWPESVSWTSVTQRRVWRSKYVEIVMTPICIPKNFSTTKIRNIRRSDIPDSWRLWTTSISKISSIQFFSTLYLFLASHPGRLLLSISFTVYSNTIRMRWVILIWPDSFGLCLDIIFPAFLMI